MYNKHPTWLSEKSSFDLKFVKIKKFFFQKNPGYATALAVVCAHSIYVQTSDMNKILCVGQTT